ncbi:MAG: tetratricopeptide repeat protein [Myxococcales bacterium]|nr:tetratricopeptide repeat protein [Myxococcales bacterium]
MARDPLSEKGFEKLKARKYDEAKALFAEAEAKAGTAHETKELLARGEAALGAGELDEASACFEAVLDRNPSLPETYFGLARLALFLGDRDSAKVHALAATRLAPDAGLSWTLLGLVHEALGEEKPALTNLAKGAKLSGDVFLCVFNLGRVLAALGKLEEGLTLLESAAGLEKGNADAFLALGVAYQKAGQGKEAVKALERAAKLAPRKLDAWATLADVLFAQKALGGARAALDDGLEACGDHPVLLEKALAAAMMEGDTQAAVAYVKRELQVVPDHQQGWLNLAGLLLLDKDVEGSERAAKEALKRNPKSWEAHFHLGNLYEAVPDDAKAEAAYRQAMVLAPKEWKPLANLGALLVQSTVKEKHQEAVKLLEKAATLAPKAELRPRYNLALAYARLGKHDRALELAREVKKAARPGDAMGAEAKTLESNLLEAR